MFEKDIAVIGIGRVGLPLSLSLSEIGFSVIGIDIDEHVVQCVNRKEMPFKEKGCDELIMRTSVEATSQLSKISTVETIIITVGTPLMSHIETDLSQITNVIHSILPHLKENHNLIFRSTVAPKTTEYVKKIIEQKTDFVIGKNLFLTFCPERIAEGKALEEIRVLPQIIGAEDNYSFEKAENIFSKLTEDILRTTYISAELVKLANNISRYIDFAVANQFAIIAENYNQNASEIISMANHKYPRGHIAAPGFTAGTCLRKDFGMINESIPYTDLLLSAWKVNEYMPKFLIDNMLKRTEIHNKNVAVLGYSFKENTDDTRDSLAPKLIRYISKEVPCQIKIHDPYLPKQIDGIFDNYEMDKALDGAQLLYIATNHKEFKDNISLIANKLQNDCWIADIWNVFRTNKIFFKAEEIKI